MLASHFLIPPGDAGVMQTMAHMKRLANDATGDPLVRDVAARIAIAHGSTRGAAQARGFRSYLEERCMFLRDPRGRELLHEPRLLLQHILQRGYCAVDCDDVATLAAALGKSVGLKARFIVVGFTKPNAPFRHVWTELSDPVKTRWIDMDITRPAQPMLPIGRVVAIDV